MEELRRMLYKGFFLIFWIRLGGVDYYFKFRSKEVYIRRVRDLFGF